MNRQGNYKEIFMKETGNIKEKLIILDSSNEEERRKNIQKISWLWMEFSNLCRKAEREGLDKQELLERKGEIQKLFQQFSDVIPIFNLLE